MTKRIPGATYRLQFNGDFTFAQAREVASYLHELGITDCYASPLFKARAESNHGYDVCDFGQLNPNLGGAVEFENFGDRLRELNMELLVDMVPNHMSTDTSNAWWFDVLQKGPNSKYANWFDIDWQRFGDNKVVLPILEDELEKVLPAGKIRLVFELEKFLIAYHDRRFPLSPESNATLSKELAEAGPDFVLKQFNGSPGKVSSFQQLNDLLKQQHYRPVYWRSAQLNYRRFFDVNELVSLRVELPEVFEAGHRLVLALAKEQKINGLRIDHPDGLWNPKQYLSRLQEKTGPFYVVVEKILANDAYEESLPGDWPVDGTTGYDFLNEVNGIFVNQANKEAFDRIYREFTGVRDDFSTMVYESKKRILLNSFSSSLDCLADMLSRIAQYFGQPRPFTLENLREILAECIAAFPVYRTYVTEETIEPGKAEREYVNLAIAGAISRGVVSQHPQSDKQLLFLRDLLRLDLPDKLDAAGKKLCREFVMKFQQLTGPVMAKGLEDTTFYNFNRLISLNEVGGNPDSFGISVENFHRHNLEKSARWPHSLLATATHDTKRGEDVRARINVLSELADEWQIALSRWRNLNAPKKSRVSGQPAPDPDDEYFFYQTLVGAWPPDNSTSKELALFRDRMVACMLKSIKESKAHTSWVEPDTGYEQATVKFVNKCLENSPANAFLDDFKIFQKKIVFFGRLNSLSQVLLKTTSPGVPDFYQGTELWDLNLVDPDNRRRVDYEIRRRTLDELRSGFEGGPTLHTQFLAELLKDDHVGRSKLYLIWRALEFRNRRRTLFNEGSFVPLAVEGAKREHICAFARIHEDEMVIAVAPRLIVTLTNGRQRLPLGPEIWEDTRVALPGQGLQQRFQNVLTNEEVDITRRGPGTGFLLSQVLAHFPVAFLERRAETR